ncbi:MAG: SRPBCC domain-containing protein [Myxococcales bacterium]|nr:SRPBCC domain-containing protein [Myxococcales bacterium]
MTANPDGAADGRATREASAFRLRYAVATTIAASPEKVWALLTDVPRMPEWNSTIEHAEGAIAPGQRVKLRVAIAPDRTFDLSVDEVVAPSRLVWSDGFRPMFRGVRTYSLTPTDGGTRFEMVEELGGLMLPMIGRSLPDFRESFEAYAADLRRAAEAS